MQNQSTAIYTHDKIVRQVQEEIDVNTFLWRGEQEGGEE